MKSYSRTSIIMSVRPRGIMRSRSRQRSLEVQRSVDFRSVQMGRAVGVMVAGVVMILVGIVLTVLSLVDRFQPSKGVGATLVLGPVMMFLGLLSTVAGAYCFGVHYKEKKENDKRKLALKLSTECSVTSQSSTEKPGTPLVVHEYGWTAEHSQLGVGQYDQLHPGRTERFLAKYWRKKSQSPKLNVYTLSSEIV